MKLSPSWGALNYLHCASWPLTCLANALNLLPWKYILVFDNSQFIRESKIDELLSELLKHPPDPSSNSRVSLSWTISAIYWALRCHSFHRFQLNFRKHRWWILPLFHLTDDFYRHQPHFFPFLSVSTSFYLILFKILNHIRISMALLGKLP